MKKVFIPLVFFFGLVIFLAIGLNRDPREIPSPLNMRWPLAIWNILFAEDDRYEAKAGKDAAWNRGAYLVEGLGHCSACHTPRNFLLAEKSDQRYAGGLQQDHVGEGKTRTWFAANLTPSPVGLGTWPEAQIQRYLKTGHSTKAGIFGPMNEVVINSLQHLTTEDAKAMATYIKSLPAAGEGVKYPLSDAQKTAGAALYKTHCDECHLDSGRGGFMKAPPLAGSAIVQAPSSASLINVIIYGAITGKGGPTPFGAWEDMKALGAKLSDEEVATIATFVRNNWDNKGTPVTAGDVAKQR